MDFLPISSHMQSKLFDKTVVRLAADVFQYAKCAADREESCTFDILIASLWMTYHGPDHDTATNKNISVKTQDGVSNVDTGRDGEDGIGDNKKDNRSVEDRVIPGSISDSVLESIESEIDEEDNAELSDDNDDTGDVVCSISEPEKNTVDTVRASDKSVKSTTEDGHVCVSENESLNKVPRGRHIEIEKVGENIPVDNEEKIQGMVQNSENVEQYSDQMVNIDRKSVEINDTIGDNTTLRGRLENIDGEALEEQKKSVENLDLNISESDSKELNMECEMENKDETMEDQNDVTDDSMIGIQITNVTGGVDLNDIPGEVKIKTELPDGLIIEINNDDNASDDEAIEESKHEGDVVMPVGLPLFNYNVRKTEPGSVDTRKSSTHTFNMYESASNLKPVMMMSNVHNSDASQTSQGVTRLDQRFAPMVSAQSSGIGQQQFTGPTSLSLNYQSQLRQTINPQKQQSVLQQHYNHPGDLPSPLPQGIGSVHGTVHGGAQDSIGLLSTSQLECSNILPAFSHLSREFITSLTKEAQSKFVSRNKVNFAALDSVIHQILQLYPFFEEKLVDLCMQLLGQNYYLFSLYKAWKDQNRIIENQNQLVVNESVQIVAMSTAPGNFEISMENVDDDMFPNTNLPLTSAGGVNMENMKYLSPLHAGNIHGCTVKRNINRVPVSTQLSDSGSQTSYQAFVLPKPQTTNTAVVQTITKPRIDNRKSSSSNKVVHVLPVTGISKHVTTMTMVPTKRVQCATVTSSEIKNRIKNRLNMQSDATKIKGKYGNVITKKKHNKRDPAVVPRNVNPNSLKNLIQNRNKKLSQLVAEQEAAKETAHLLQAAKRSTTKKCATVSKIKKGSNGKKIMKDIKKESNSKKIIKKIKKEPDERKLERKMKKADPDFRVKHKIVSTVKTETETPPVKKKIKKEFEEESDTVNEKLSEDIAKRKPVGYKQLAELQRQAGDDKSVGCWERGAKLKAQKKLNVYNEMISTSSSDNSEPSE